MTKLRYKVINDSDSAHCCFEASVIDTQTPTISSPGITIKDYTSICECMDIAQAHFIAKILNEKEHMQSKHS